MGSRRIRDAASVVAARASSDGPEVLVLQRGLRSRFLPGYVVFPGGAIDRRDLANAKRWFRSRQEAARACAVRELLEEAGLVLTAEGLKEAPSDAPMAAVEASPPVVEQLPLISRWIAPRDVPARFDVRFFAVEAPPGLRPRADGGEAARAWWTRPADLLRDWAARRRLLFWPTMKVLDELSRLGDVEEILAAVIPQQEPVGAAEEARMPPSTFWQRI